MPGPRTLSGSYSHHRLKLCRFKEFVERELHLQVFPSPLLEPSRRRSGKPWPGLPWKWPGKRGKTHQRLPLEALRHLQTAALRRSEIGSWKALGGQVLSGRCRVFKVLRPWEALGDSWRPCLRPADLFESLEKSRNLGRQPETRKGIKLAQAGGGKNEPTHQSSVCGAREICRRCCLQPPRSKTPYSKP